jgi:xeroderma pigmentosum group C-complementing protein
MAHFDDNTLEKEVALKEPDFFTYASNDSDANRSAEDDDEDIEWEDVEVSKKKEPGNEADLGQSDIDLTKINWQNVNAELEENENKISLKTKRNRRITKEEKEHSLEVHKCHLLLLLNFNLKCTQVFRNSIVEGYMLSLISTTCYDFYSDFKSKDTRYCLEQVVRWFHHHFDHINLSDPKYHDEEHLITSICSRKGDDKQLLMLFLHLCHSIGLEARYTCSLDPHLFKYSKGLELSHSKSAQMMANEENEMSVGLCEMAHSITNFCWAEVFDKKNCRWIHVDPLRKLVDCPNQVEVALLKGSPVIYVISIDENKHVIDVTPRYSAKWSKTIRFRLAHVWFNRILDSRNQQLGMQRSSTIKEEQKFLNAMMQSEEMPTSLEGFKNHPIYCLERHLGQYECLHPRKPIGVFKGKPVFYRKNVHTVLNEIKWRQRGREVLGSERSKPCKTLKRGRTFDDIYLSLYGIWQTRSYVPPAVQNGIIPKNQYGNIEVWSEECIPQGATHLRLPRIEKIAKELGIEYAPAMVGYEVKQGKPYPKFDGVVVCSQNVDTLLEAHAVIQHTTIQRAIEKNQSILHKRWERFIKRLLLRKRLELDYGRLPT